MSKLGIKPIFIDNDISIKVLNDNFLYVTNVLNPEETGRIFKPDYIQCTIEPDKVYFNINEENKKDRKKHAYFGMIRQIVNNWCIGIKQKWHSKIILKGIGYKFQNEEDRIIFFLNKSHTECYKKNKSIFYKFENNNVNSFVMYSFDKNIVTQEAMNIRKLRQPNIYDQTGVFIEGRKERVKMKSKKGK